MSDLEPIASCAGCGMESAEDGHECIGVAWLVGAIMELIPSDQAADLYERLIVAGVDILAANASRWRGAEAARGWGVALGSVERNAYERGVRDERARIDEWARMVKRTAADDAKRRVATARKNARKAYDAGFLNGISARRSEAELNRQRRTESIIKEVPKGLGVNAPT